MSLNILTDSKKILSLQLRQRKFKIMIKNILYFEFLDYYNNSISIKNKLDT